MVVISSFIISATLSQLTVGLIILYLIGLV
jgi:hypothetical protein